MGAPQYLFSHLSQESRGAFTKKPALSIPSVNSFKYTVYSSLLEGTVQVKTDILLLSFKHITALSQVGDIGPS